MELSSGEYGAGYSTKIHLLFSSNKLFTTLDDMQVEIEEFISKHNFMLYVSHYLCR